MSCKLILAKNYHDLSCLAANIVIHNLIVNNFKFNLALPTGNSPKLMYEILVTESHKQNLDWSQVNFFALDEYLDVDLENTFANYLWQYFYKSIKLNPQKLFNPVTNPDYDNLINSLGGLALTILGVGENGHIAFNEPHTPQLSYTHSLWLSESTRLANRKAFAQGSTIPNKAISVGLKTILASSAIIVLISGKSKTAILNKFLSGYVNNDLPLSQLHYHNNWTIITDLPLEKTNLLLPIEIINA